MPILLIVGLAALLVGIILFFTWFGHLLALIKAVAPLVFMVGGAVAAYLGWEEMKDKKTPPLDFSNPDEAGRYTAEAKAYQAEIKEIREETNREDIIEVSQVEDITVEESVCDDDVNEGQEPKN